jgi:hypothetical protein
MNADRKTEKRGEMYERWHEEKEEKHKKKHNM